MADTLIGQVISHRRLLGKLGAGGHPNILTIYSIGSLVQRCLMAGRRL